MTGNDAGRLDDRFSDPKASAASWEDATRLLEQAELYWLTSVRPDGRPNVTPLIGLWLDGAFHLTTGLREQKFRNIEANDRVAVTTGRNAWDKGTDVVVEGRAVRIADHAAMQAIADAYVAKYGEVWRFTVREDGLEDATGGTAAVFGVDVDKVIVFAKDPHGQTTFRRG